MRKVESNQSAPNIAVHKHHHFFCLVDWVLFRSCLSFLKWVPYYSMCPHRPISGASMNPARSIGPAVVSLEFTYIWVYILGPVAGAIAGAAAYSAIRCHSHNTPVEHGCCQWLHRTFEPHRWWDWLRRCYLLIQSCAWAPNRQSLWEFRLCALVATLCIPKIAKRIFRIFWHNFHQSVHVN